MSRTAALVSLLSLSLGLAAWDAIPSTATGAARRAWFKDHYLGQTLNLGVGYNPPMDWVNSTRTSNGISWKFRAMYASGGVSPSDNRGWHNVFYNPVNEWVQAAYDPSHTAAQYKSTPALRTQGIWLNTQTLRPARDNNLIPWVTTYNLAQSWPSNYAGDAVTRVATNAKNTSTMKLWWQQLTTLFKRVGEMPDLPVVVHIEPDEWAHLLISDKKPRTEALHPEAIQVQVAATGLADLAGLSNTMIGFAQGIERLRDKYAINNAMLAVSPSPWDHTGRQSQDKWVAALTAMGVTDWEFAVCETASADYGQQHPTAPTPYPATLGMAGGIDNVITWAGAIHQGTGLPFVLWQIPVGNTVKAVCNNTPGHYKHNSVQLLLDGYPVLGVGTNQRLAGFVANGGIGLIFAGGQGASTNPWNKLNTGSGGSGEDDGGYLREQLSRYSTSPLSLP